MSETVTAVKKVHTACKECTFAFYKENTQTGCELGRVERFREQDSESILEVYDAQDTEFFVINGRLCNAFRNRHSDWASKHADRVARVNEELKLCLSVLVVIEESGTTQENLRKTALSLKEQTLPPAEVHFIDNQDSIPTPRLHALLHKALGNSITWRLTSILEKDDEGQRPPRGRAIDVGVLQATAGNYYAVFTAGFPVPPDFVASVHEALNERLERFNLLTPLLDGNALVVQQAMHRHPLICGNAPGWSVAAEGEESVFLEDLVAKVTHLASKNGQDHMVKGVCEVCPSLLAQENTNISCAGKQA